jgi:effector-binding domain-containing protein
MKHQVETTTVTARSIAAVRFTAADPDEIAARMGPAFQAVAAAAARQGRAVHGPAIALYQPLSGDLLAPASMTVTAGFPLSGEGPVLQDGEVGPFEVPGGPVATTTHVGSYETLPEAYTAVTRAAEAGGWELDDGSMWEEYWSGPEAPVDETRTVLFWPLRSA